MFVSGRGGSEGIHVWYSVPIIPFFLFLPLTIVSTFVSLICQRSMTDLSAAC